MRRAAQVATIGFVALVAFQAALAAGAPLGEAAWGGTDSQLGTGERVGSAVSVFVYLLAILVVRGTVAGRAERRYRWGIWAYAVLFGLAALMNVASKSSWENFLLAPLALVLAVSCVVAARGARRVPRRGHLAFVAGGRRTSVW